jgi:hypothetical protein
MSSPTAHPLPPLRSPTGRSLPPPDGEYKSILQHSRGLSSTSFTHAGSPASMTSPSPSPSPSSLSPSHSLRKSFSVDSFVHYGRDNRSTINPHSDRVFATSGVSPPQCLVFNAASRINLENEPFSSSSRFRGEAVASTSEKGSMCFIGDSDVERSDPLNRLSDWDRRGSSKVQNKNRSAVKAGDLPLPSRTPTFSMTSMSTTGSVSIDHLPRLNGVASMQTTARRGTNPSSGITSGRSRSGSLGVYVNQSSKPSLLNSQVPMVCILLLYAMSGINQESV